MACPPGLKSYLTFPERTGARRSSSNGLPRSHEDTKKIIDSYAALPRRHGQSEQSRRILFHHAIEIAIREALGAQPRGELREAVDRQRDADLPHVGREDHRRHAHLSNGL